MANGDVSELERLRGRIRELERKNALLERFVAMAAHELAEPLVITEASAIAMRERIEHALDFASRRDLLNIINVAARMRMLVETFALDAREAGEVLRVQPVDLAEVVNECLAMLAPDIERHRASVEVDPLPVVRGNAALLRGVFSNLIANALKYSGGDIKVKVVHSEADWVFAVDSPGRPIPDDEQQSIFEPWKRGSYNRRVRGTGMGLAIVRRAVERHGGHVGVTRAGNSMNRFFFTLPA